MNTSISLWAKIVSRILLFCRVKFDYNNIVFLKIKSFHDFDTILSYIFVQFIIKIKRNIASSINEYWFLWKNFNKNIFDFRNFALINWLINEICFRNFEIVLIFEFFLDKIVIQIFIIVIINLVILVVWVRCTKFSNFVEKRVDILELIILLFDNVINLIIFSIVVLSKRTIIEIKRVWCFVLIELNCNLFCWENKQN